jgi:hypothetical protein
MSTTTTITYININNNEVDSLNPRGRVVELAFLEDDRLAELVSWCFQSKMSAVVVDTKEETAACFELGAK